MRLLFFISFLVVTLVAFADIRLIMVMGSGLRSFPDAFSMTPVAKTAAVVPIVRFGKLIPFSIAHWTKVTAANNPATGNGGAIIGMVDNSGGNGWDTYNAAALNGYTDFGYQPRLSFANPSSTSTVGVEPVVSIADGNWHFTVTTYNGANSGSPTTDILISIDNVFVATNSVHSASLSGDWTTSTNPFVLGARPNGGGTVHGFNGLIDLVSIWDIQLNANQISQLYNSRTPLDVRTVSFASHCVYFAPIGEGADTTSSIHDLINGNDMTGTGVTFNSSIP